VAAAEEAVAAEEVAAAAGALGGAGNEEALCGRSHSCDPAYARRREVRRAETLVQRHQRLLELYQAYMECGTLGRLLQPPFSQGISRHGGHPGFDRHRALLSSLGLGFRFAGVDGGG
jgi:hypothetical protein